MQGKILVVHRNELILDVIREMLQDLGYAVTQAKDGHRALGKALSTHFNIIVVNHVLNGGLTGSQLVERMKKYGVRAPIIGTAPNATWDVPTGFVAGTVDYLLPSPFDYAELIKAVESLSNGKAIEPAVQEPVSSETDPFSEPEWPEEPQLHSETDFLNTIEALPPALPPAIQKPLPAAPIHRPSSFMPPEEPQRIGAPRVLLVETDRKVCKQIEHHFTRAGFEVAIFHNGKDAYENTMLTDYEFILTDLWLPGMDGFEMIETMRKSGVDVPIAILTAHITRDMVQELIVHRICKIVLKPFKPHDLLALVQAQVI